MKLKAIIACILVATILSVATPALALSLGVSPTQVELEVPGGGSTITSVNIHYFTGDVDISLVDIPLRIEPSTIHVDALDEPVVVELTVYGNHSLDNQVYDGYIRFIAVSGGAATGGVQVIAQITNIADGIAPPEELVIEEPIETVLEETVVTEEPVVEEPAESVTTPTASETVAEETITAPDKPWLIPVAAGGGGLVLILIVLFTVAWRRGWVA